MIKPELKSLCLGCMTEKDYDGPCRQCGYTGLETTNADYVVPGTILGERYLVGKLLSSNGEGAVYIGYDSDEDVKVFIREFMPGKLVTRNHSNLHLKPIAGSEAVYKSLLAEFEDLCSILKGFGPSQGISQVQCSLRENDTSYVIFRYRNMMTLGEFITQCGGEIKWSRFKKMYLSLLNTLSQIHKKGLIHAGISPQTILIDEKGNPFFGGFAINALRARGSELECELFDGYSAPEQYENVGRYGEWTDVYAISAVLYRTITGSMPPNAQDRRLSDNLIDAAELDSNIPQNISDAIHNGMLLTADGRTQNADELSAQLLDNTETNTAIYCGELPPVVQQAPALTKREAKRAQKEIRRLERGQRQKSHTLLSVLIPMLLTTALLGVFLWVFFKYKYTDLQHLISPDTSTSISSAELTEESDPEEELSAVPEFIGQYVDSITANSDYVAQYDFVTKYDYSDLYANGVVFNQEPKSGTPMANRGTVILHVSKGKDTMPMPNLAGSTVELAIQTLTDLGLSYSIVEVANEDYQEGIVKYTEPPADTNIHRSNTSFEVLLYTKKLTPASSSSTKESSSESEDSSESSSNKYKVTKPSEPSKPTARKRDPSELSSSSKSSWRDQ